MRNKTENVRRAANRGAERDFRSRSATVPKGFINSAHSGIKWETTLKTSILLAASFVVGAIMTAVSSAAPPAAAPHVTEVIVLDVGAHMQKLLELSKRMEAIQTKFQGTGKARIWQGSWAGSEAGRVIVTVEFPSLRSLAESEDRTRGVPELEALFAEVDASGIKVLSDSLVTEVSR